jgi:hypothetical protein
VIDKKSTANAARPVLLSFLPGGPPDEDVAAAGCSGLLDLVIEVKRADEVMVGVTSVIDVTTPPADFGEADGAILVNQSCKSSGKISGLTCWLRGEFRRFI